MNFRYTGKIKLYDSLSVYLLNRMSIILFRQGLFGTKLTLVLIRLLLNNTEEQFLFDNSWSLCIP